MNNVLEYIYNHPKEIKRIIGTTDEQLIKLIENPQKVEKKKIGERQPRKKVNQGRRRKKKVFKQDRRDNVDLILFVSCTNISGTRSNIWS